MTPLPQDQILDKTQGSFIFDNHRFSPSPLFNQPYSLCLVLCKDSGLLTLTPNVINNTYTLIIACASLGCYLLWGQQAYTCLSHIILSHVFGILVQYSQIFNYPTY